MGEFHCSPHKMALVAKLEQGDDAVQAPSMHDEEAIADAAGAMSPSSLLVDGLPEPN